MEISPLELHYWLLWLLLWQHTCLVLLSPILNILLSFLTSGFKQSGFVQPQGPLLFGLDAPVGCVTLLKTWPELVAPRQGAFDSFAMGNYPYPSTYMGGALPAWPMRAACDHLAKEKPGKEDLLQVRHTLSSLHC